MTRRANMGLRVQRDAALYALGLNPANVRWDHRPPLSVRPFIEVGRARRYTPDENDPRYIVPLTPENHDKRTFGTSKATTVGSDIHTAAKVKRIEKDEAEFRRRLLAKANGEPRQKRGRMKSRPFQKRPNSNV